MPPNKKPTKPRLSPSEVETVIAEAQRMRELGDVMCQFILLASDKATWHEANQLTPKATAAAQEWKGHRRG